MTSSLFVESWPPQPVADRYRPLTLHALRRSSYWRRLPPDVQEALVVVSLIVPFCVGEYVLRELIDWDRIPDDPIFRMTFPHADMLDSEDYAALAELRRRKTDPGADVIAREVARIREGLGLRPAGSTAGSVPTLDGRPIHSLRHAYRETVRVAPAPAAGRWCHLYRTGSWRRGPFAGLPEARFQSCDVDDMVAYLKARSEVTEVTFAGGDPMMMRAEVLRRYVEPLLHNDLEHVRTIRIDTESPARWPQRFLTDRDTAEVLSIFAEVVRRRRHLVVMGDFSHPRELEPVVAQRAVRRIRSTGAEIRMRAPLLRGVNDDPAAWEALWKTGARTGMIPNDMYIERDAGPNGFFDVKLARAHEIFRQAYSRIPAAARTARGPSMSARPGEIRLLGESTLGGHRCFVLDFLRAKDPEWVRRPFFARFDPDATWFDDLQPAFAGQDFFFDDGLLHPHPESPPFDPQRVLTAQADGAGT